MLPSRQQPFLDLRIKLWKARAQAKQMWLERMLSMAPADAREIARRNRWIRRALDRVRRAQTAVRSRASLLDGYTEHLSVLEMTLMGATEEKPAKTPSGTKAE